MRGMMILFAKAEAVWGLNTILLDFHVMNPYQLCKKVLKLGSSTDPDTVREFSINAGPANNDCLPNLLQLCLLGETVQPKNGWQGQQREIRDCIQVNDIGVCICAKSNILQA